MKNIIATVMLWGWILMPSLNAQTFLRDTIRIMDGEQMSVRIMHKDIQELKKYPVYKELITSFQTHLESIKDQIPDYLNYKMTYVKDINLSIEEITGFSKYKVENGQIAAAYNSNIALLQSKDFKIELFFYEVDELFKTDYNIMIEKALNKLKKDKKKFITIVRPLNYTYSYATDELTKGTKKRRDKITKGFTSGFSVGLYKNDPIYDFTLGFGIQFKNESVAYLFYKGSYQYDKELEKIKNGSLWGFAYKPTKLGSLYVAFPLKRDEIYKDLDFQAGVVFYPYRRLSVTTSLNYLKDTGNKFLPGVSIGFGF